MADDGSMARGDQLQKFSEKHELKIISIEDLIRFIRKKKKIVNKIESINLPTKIGKFELHLYEENFNGKISRTIFMEHFIRKYQGKI